MKTLATLRTYDPHDLTSTGYSVTIRENGTARLEYRSRWQGSYTGRVYIADLPDSVMIAARGEAGEEQPDLETAVLEWLASSCPDEWRMIRRGYKVR